MMDWALPFPKPPSDLEFVTIETMTSFGSIEQLSFVRGKVPHKTFPSSRVFPIDWSASHDNLHRPWLENPRAPCPTGHVSLKERGEVFGYGWKFSASATDLRKVEGHHGVDEPDHDEFSTGAGRESIRRNDGDSLPSLDHRDLCIQIIHGESGLICDAGLCEASVYKLLQRNG